MRVQACCCGCTLQLGTTIIGIFYLICSTVWLISSSILAANYSDESYVEYIVDSLGHLTVSEADTLRTALLAVGKVLIVCAVIAGIEVVFNVALLVGVFKRIPGCVLTWVIFMSVYLTLQIIGGLGSAIFFFVTNGVLLAAGISTLIGVAIASSIVFYFIVVVYSFYKELQEGEVSSSPYGKTV